MSITCPECGSIMCGGATLKCSNCEHTATRGPCVTCGQPATTDWVGEGGVLAWTHGMSSPRCKRCCLVDQIAYARKVVARLPELEAELREIETVTFRVYTAETAQNRSDIPTVTLTEIDSRFCTCTHAPEQHGPDGCKQCPVPSFSRPSRNCPWDGRKR
jgi:hypothetical protein